MNFRHFFGDHLPGQQRLLDFLAETWSMTKGEVRTLLGQKKGRQLLRNVIRRIKLYNCVTGLYLKGAYPLTERVKDASSPFGDATLKDYLKETHDISCKEALPLINHGALRLPLETFFIEPPKAPFAEGEAVADSHPQQGADIRSLVVRAAKAGQKRRLQN
ncbi:hypothetical protein AAVH_25317 [Aphelenchoides avenae]|nr:hypothetical protein AAVH_25317 [Aphelenchus avenae]